MSQRALSEVFFGACRPSVGADVSASLTITWPLDQALLLARRRPAFGHAKLSVEGVCEKLPLEATVSIAMNPLRISYVLAGHGSERTWEFRGVRAGFSHDLYAALTMLVLDDRASGMRLVLRNDARTAWDRLWGFRKA